jgi:hypothetical protein
MLYRRMRKFTVPIRLIAASCALLIVTGLFAAASLAQAPPPNYPNYPPQQQQPNDPNYPPQQAAPNYPNYPPQQTAPNYPPPSFPPQELERVASRIALYPDPLLAQILTASTFSNDIPAAAQWADQHHYLTGDALAQAITGDQLPWDPSVQALLPFPSVLDMMASGMGWTQELGNAVLAQRPDVMDAVQRMRRKASDFGYLRTNQGMIVGTGPYITIMPANPAIIVVPAYDPVVVFARPRPGFFVGGAIRFGFGINIGFAFQPWGWGVSRFDWGGHALIINNAPWGRTWSNRTTYVHPYTVRRFAPAAPRPAERHALEQRSQSERAAPKAGRAVREEHSKGRERKEDGRR